MKLARTGLAWIAVALSVPGLSAQGRRGRRETPAQARATAVAAEKERLAATALANLNAHAWESAARAYTSLLQLDPGDEAARDGLGTARYQLCREQAWQIAAGDRLDQARTELAVCAAPPAEQSGQARELALLAQVASIEAALERTDWGVAAAAMARLPAPPWPAGLSATLAPAYARFGAGDARAAEEIVRASAAVPSPAIAAFDAFLRDRYRRRVLRALWAPSLGLFGLALVASLFIGLRREHDVVTGGETVVA